MNIIFIGDICGKPGVDYLIEKINFLKTNYNVNMIIANTENADRGKGLDFESYQNLYLSGVDVMTMGNHIWHNKNIKNFINQTDIICPLNFKFNNLGYGYKIIKRNSKKILIMNALGRVFMNNQEITCPFKQINKILNSCYNQYDYSFLDFHAEATSEKMALAHYFDGKIDAIVGTHTHIQTNDNKLLPKKTLYISDVGMTGVSDSVIGFDKDIIISNFLNNSNNKMKNKIAMGKRQLNAVFLTLGKVKKITKINISE
ncbi:MAG: TIGR00282 family metallophosphoesterase [Vigna little leaf phytoplasma]|nr:TIGR00282 family metallophosphoesterase [Vigna little leaf phytoplasma]